MTTFNTADPAETPSSNDVAMVVWSTYVGLGVSSRAGSSTAPRQLGGACEERAVAELRFNMEHGAGAPPPFHHEEAPSSAGSPHAAQMAPPRRAPPWRSPPLVHVERASRSTAPLTSQRRQPSCQTRPGARNPPSTASPLLRTSK